MSARDIRARDIRARDIRARDIRARNREYRRDQQQDEEQLHREIDERMQQARQLRESRARIHHKLRIREERGVRIVPRSWGALFQLLLMDVLRTQLPLNHQNDLCFMDETGGDDDDYFNIRSIEEYRLGQGRRGNVAGLLCIMLNSNDPN